MRLVNQNESSENEDKIYFSEISKERSKKDLEELRKLQKNI